MKLFLRSIISRGSRFLWPGSTPAPPPSGPSRTIPGSIRSGTSTGTGGSTGGCGGTGGCGSTGGCGGTG
ncbi:MAG TPA: TIGR04222 domain-containing membrane protein, partial [Planctomycetes bacterium]|nr:TIGR04222 domain-containing membrane protein [Planctomycetota bacterium]